MKQKNIVSMICVLVVIMSAVITLTSCTSVKTVREHGLTAKLLEKDYEILGRVQYRGVDNNVLGLFSWGSAALGIF